MERYPLVWNSHFYLVSSLVSYPSDPDPAAVYPLTLAPARLHVHAICCILKAKPAALHGSVLSAEPCLSIHCLMASANCPTQTTLAFAVLWLDTVQIPRPPLLQLLPLARRMPFAASHGWRQLRRPRHLVLPQQNKGVAARASYTADIGQRLRKSWAANIVQLIIRMVARHLLNALASVDNVRASQTTYVDAKICCAVIDLIICKP